MKKLLISVVLCLMLPAVASAQKGYTISGIVIDSSNGNPVEFATVLLTDTEQWAVADMQGKFVIKNVPAGKNHISVSCLGYVAYNNEIQITKDITGFKASLSPDNLSLEGAMVTAKEDGNSTTTARTIDRTALDHVQIMNLADISSLLPGGATVDPSLTTEKQFNIRAGSSESGNASFGTAVEVDGVRLSNNASYATASTSNTIKGVSTNSIASTNVESVEVITGVPSVEYGDMSSGVVKVNLKKGKTPWMITASTSPNTKQTSVSKGFGLGSGRYGRARGVLNTSIEYTESISKQMSPYTAYRREQISVSYMNIFNNGFLSSMPLRLSLGVTGNLGGMDTKADPDAFQGTWSKANDNAIRGNFSLNWLLSKPWITSFEVNGSIAYSDATSKERTYNSSAINKDVLHGKEAGYFMSVPYAEDVPPVMYIPGGHWYNIMCDDNRPMTTRLSAKANLAHNIAKASSKLKIGAEWSTDRNFGIGAYSEDMSTAPTFREYRYCDNPVMHNVAVYAEENLMIPVGKGRINLVAGLRNDNTIIKGSAYGTTSSLSPRFNAKYTILPREGRSRKSVRELAVRANWGQAVKLPSFSVLFPMPTYRDIRVFSSTTNSNNESFSAYYIMPRDIEYNPDLKWQRNRVTEIGIETDLFGNKISLTGYWNRTFDAYKIYTAYDRAQYAYTPDSSLGGVSIAADDRVFTIDAVTGLVTVSDKNGILPSQTLANLTYKELDTRYYPGNEANPIDRYGLEWVIDFVQIKPIHTDVRLDGSWYHYKGLSYTWVQNAPVTQRSAQDGMPYRYIGHYLGGNSYSNGSESTTLRTNVTLTTHIPDIRMIVSVKVEASLLKYSRTLSETPDGQEIAKVVSDKSDILSTVDGASIYDGNTYVIRYPEYYSTYDDPTQRDFLADLIAAREAGNDKLFSDLKLLTYGSNYLYIFEKDYYSPFLSANFSVTKEIGDLASISFYANNFFVNRAQIWSTKTQNYVSAASYVPKFYYGLTLRLTF
ncbi:MAG: TonB-dependent receptor [Bacteroidales bacterium]|nr:TonB-dependent receptor [Bacteroidales bacterium]